MNHFDLPLQEERARLSAVRRYAVLDTPPDGAFDRVARLAARLLDVPIAIISIVDEDRIWFKSHEGLDGVEEIPRDPGLCASAILQDGPWILSDASVEPVALANPLVAGEFGLRFYAGIPLRTQDGYGLGTLCVIDKEPREITSAQTAILEELAAVVMDELELRREAIDMHKALRREVREKELLAEEVEHRIMNSLQLISSVARRKAAQHDGVVATELNDIAARIRAIAQANRHIQQSLPGHSKHGDLALFLEVLGRELFPLCPKGGLIEVECPSLQLDRGQLVSLGHLITELVLNSVKSGAQRIGLQGDATEGHLRLLIDDDGPGLEEDFDPHKSKGLGMVILQAMAQKLEAEVTWGRSPDGGARFAVKLPLTLDSTSDDGPAQQPSIAGV
ncbi:two-component sensor histidine kinase [Pseudooceanicola batsensis HTCC2597]|uniref:histidine kinase n=1 Tax=Pseudooceanicola batsensis (strain ATCC BAA-863 / DSM 15984 / KCTC 12145 / HTCC2597) TaxID=252305 RepID=A3TSF0_PSEBH|nr:GAF domain-containing protein [Pseudooceanicola batsensis]EAQ04577.1 two-component sensor histidine kinase [Pseudooceanicola batsensis HTCC2597]